MKIIDLLNKIAKGNIPKKVKYDGNIYKIEDCLIVGKEYQCKDEEGFTMILDFDIESLNDEVEIIEEEKKTPTLNDIRESYGLPRIEEKKIPEKLDIELNSGDENKVNYYRATNLECDLAFKINEIIDYLKSKGE